MNLVAKYNYCLTTRPVLTKMLTSGTIGALGDILCQSMEKCKVYILIIASIDYNKGEKTTFSFKRTQTFFIMGTFFVAPILHMSYSKILPYLVPEATAKGALKKLAIDQLVAAPIIILLFYPMINFVEGKPLS